MKLVFIYGPMAVGKTTVGRALAEATGYKFFYNHLTVPAADAIFPLTEPWHAEHRVALLETVRLECIAAAAKQGVDIIFTLAYSGAVNDKFVADVVNAVASHGGHTHFVQLRADEEVLRARVGNASRVPLGKNTDPDYLSRVLVERDMTASVKYPGIQILDTAVLTPAQSAQQILDAIGHPSHEAL